MLLEGKYTTSLIPVLVDALGQLYTIISGSYGGVPTPILLDVAGRILAHLVGNDGGTIRDVTVDASGKMIIRVQGSDGGTLRDVAVDAAGIMLSRMKGSDGGTLRDVAVDSSGFLMALMKGLDGVTLRTIAVDASGIMKANLSAQSFDFLRVRPVYGESQMADSGYITIHNGVWTSVFSTTGRGAILGGHVSMVGGAAMANTNIRIQVEGVTLASHRYDEMNGLQLYNDPQLPVSLLEYDEIAPYGIIRIGSNLTFETSVDVSSYQSSGTDKLVRGVIYYSLVPTA